MREASRITGRHIALMLDTKGPEVRTGKLENAPVELNTGDTFVFTNDQDFIGNNEKVSTTYTKLPEKVICRTESTPGTTILVADGLLAFEVISVWYLQYF